RVFHIIDKDFHSFFKNGQFDMENPSLYVYDFKRSNKAGYIRLRLTNACRMANFTISAIDQYNFQLDRQALPPLPQGTIAQWQVSNVLAANSLDGQERFPKAIRDTLSWQTLKSEFTGITNLSRVAKVTESHNTVLAKILVESDRDQVKALQFGYSDAVKIYHNDQLLFEGQCRFRSRDFRYLGTIGLYEQVYLPLRKGRNEIMLAVSEAFGGWGVMAKWLDQSGLKIMD
ncbi:MAG: hypothetical protein AAFP19_27165, partial [Bacteroidota bacterium]